MFEKNKLEDNGDLEDAKDRLEFLSLRKGKLIVFIALFTMTEPSAISQLMVKKTIITATVKIPTCVFFWYIIHRDVQSLHCHSLLYTGLRDAILRRHPGILDKAIQDAESSQYQQELQSHIDRARALKDHQDELDNYRHDILEMDQACISEIRSYHHPPDGVHETMMSTYLILGYKEEQLEVSKI